MDLVDFVISSIGVVVLIYFVMSTVSKSKINFEETLLEKICPSCLSSNKLENEICDKCGKVFDYTYDDDVCLNCGYVGRMKRKSDGWFFRTAFAYVYFFSGNKKYKKICKKCNRLIRESDFTKQQKNNKGDTHFKVSKGKRKNNKGVRS